MLDPFERKNVADIVKRNRQIQALLSRANRDIAYRFSTVKGKRFAKVMQKEIKELQAQMEKNIEKGVKQHWRLGDARANKVLDGYVQNIKIEDGLYKSFRAPNLHAMDAFLNRVDKGMNLSDRVWNVADSARAQMEEYLGSGIAIGKPAIKVAKEMDKFLAGKPIKYKGTLIKGANVSYQAIRLAATETNMSFRTADQMKMQSLPFVTGMHIHLDPSHPREDICNDLVGDYPKDFQWAGWHPFCICYATWDKLKKEDFVQYMKTGKMPQSNIVKDLPTRFQNYMADHAEAFKGYIARGTEPYWVRDNVGYLEGVVPKVEAAVVKKAVYGSPGYEKLMTTNEIVSSAKLKQGAKGVNETVKIKIKDNGTAAFKPIDGEEKYLQNMAGGTLASRERAAYLIDREIGLNQVPTTVIRTVNGKKGSAQYWVDNAKQHYYEYNIPTGTKLENFKKVYEHEKRRMDVFDALIQNRDRHDLNFLVRPNGRIIYIDNGFSLVSKDFGVSIKDEAIKDFMSDVSLEELTKWKKGLDKIISTRFQEQLVADAGLNVEAVVELTKRARYIREMFIKKLESLK